MRKTMKPYRLVHDIIVGRHLCALAAICLALALAGCQDDNRLPADKGAVAADGTVTVEGTIAVPAMPVVSTRGAAGDQAGAGLKLTLLEFDAAVASDGSVDPARSFLTHVYEATIIDATTAVADGTLVRFQVTLFAASTHKVLHLVLAGDYVKPGYGSIASLLPAMSTGDNEEAYWGQVDCPDGFTVWTDSNGNGDIDDGELALRDDLKTDLLQGVPLIRNFAKVSVKKASTLLASTFDFWGFGLVNVPTSGTIAPWNTTRGEVPALLDGKQMKGYAAVTGDDVGYHGVMPVGVAFTQQEATARSWEYSATSGQKDLNTSPRYIYEHPYESTRRTYLIVCGSYKGAQKASYYKVDIGTFNEATGIFDNYDIIRNIHYKINIVNVLGPGYSSVADAIDNTPSNNLISSTETASMLNISDGNNMLIVNDLNHIIVEAGQEVKVRYRYFTDVTGTKKADNAVPYIEELAGGSVADGYVISSVAEGTTTTDKRGKTVGAKDYTDSQGVSWKEFTVKVNSPADITDGMDREQAVKIVDGKGLGRTINFLLLAKPKEYEAIVVRADAEKSEVGFYDDMPTSNSTIGTAAGKGLTLYFNLPEGLRESMFPLTFTIESYRQGVENNKIGNMVVTSGNSLFTATDDTDFPSLAGTLAIQYKKTVSYKEYLYQYDPTLGDYDVGKNNANHTIRCFFSTITKVTSGTKAKLLVHNEYFRPDATVTFTRQ